MKIEIAFDDAVGEFCKEHSRRSYNRPSPDEVAGWSHKLLETLINYDDNVAALISILEDEADDTRARVSAHFAEIDEKEKEA
jgi:hypothetical protein